MTKIQNLDEKLIILKRAIKTGKIRIIFAGFFRTTSAPISWRPLGHCKNKSRRHNTRSSTRVKTASLHGAPRSSRNRKFLITAKQDSK